MDDAWCYLCRMDTLGVDPQVLWGIALDDDLGPLERSDAPMTEEIAGYLRFLCAEFGLPFDPTFTQGEAATVIGSFLAEPASETQDLTLTWLADRAGAPIEPGLTYAAARTKIRRMVALRGLRSA
jgi:hypothetical protein